MNRAVSHWLVISGLLLCLSAVVSPARAQRLISWGNDPGRLIAGTPTGKHTAISAGFYNSVAIRSDGTLDSWGDDTFGTVSKTPKSGSFSAVSAGPNYNGVALALRT